MRSASDRRLPAARPLARAPRTPCAACAVREASLCGELSADELAQISRLTNHVALGRGEQLFIQDDPARHGFIVMAGVLKIYKLMTDGRRQITGFLFPGDYVGLAEDECYAYAAEALRPSRLCRFPKRRLEMLMERYPSMERRLLRMVSAALAVAQDQMVVLGRKTARERIASFLLALAGRSGGRRADGERVWFPMTRTDTADYLGLTMETVSRSLSRLRREGVIRSSGDGYLEILDLAELKGIAEGEGRAARPF